jgi:hypothetical protein
MSRSQPESIRLTPSPMIPFYIACGSSSIMVIPGIFQILDGSRNAAMVVGFLCLICLFVLVLALIGGRSYITADREAVTFRHKGKDTVIPWTSVSDCVMMPMFSQILIRWKHDGTADMLKCYYSKRNAAFVQSCAEQYGIPVYGP